jgi:hypothetical protein
MDRGLTDDEVAAVLAFLGSLDCPEELAEPVLPVN